MVSTLSTSPDDGCWLSTCTGAAGSAVCGRRESGLPVQGSIVLLRPNGAFLGRAESLPGRRGAASCAVGCRHAGSAGIVAIYRERPAECDGRRGIKRQRDDGMLPAVRSGANVPLDFSSLLVAAQPQLPGLKLPHDTALLESLAYEENPQNLPGSQWPKVSLSSLLPQARVQPCASSARATRVRGGCARPDTATSRAR